MRVWIHTSISNLRTIEPTTKSILQYLKVKTQDRHYWGCETTIIPRSGDATIPIPTKNKAVEQKM